MATRSEIELIPQEVKAGKARSSQARLFQLGAIVFFIAAASITGLLLFYRQILAQNLETAQSESARHEAAITDLADIETKIVSLAERATGIPKIFTERDYFSVALSAISVSRPAGLDVTGLSMEKDEREVAINGETQNYNLLSQFLDNLVDPQKGGTLFADAGLTSVNLDPSSGTITFTIEATLKANGLKKPLPERAGQ